MICRRVGWMRVNDPMHMSGNLVPVPRSCRCKKPWQKKTWLGGKRYYLQKGLSKTSWGPLQSCQSAPSILPRHNSVQLSPSSSNKILWLQCDGREEFVENRGNESSVARKLAKRASMMPCICRETWCQSHFLFLYSKICCTVTQLDLQLHQERTQVVRSEKFFFRVFWFWIHTASAPSTTKTRTDGGAVKRKPWLEGTTAISTIFIFCFLIVVLKQTFTYAYVQTIMQNKIHLKNNELFWIVIN